MSTMPRPKSKATKIAYKVLGKPSNLQASNKKDSKKDKVLMNQYTARVK